MGIFLCCEQHLLLSYELTYSFIEAKIKFNFHMQFAPSFRKDNQLYKYPSKVLLAGGYGVLQHGNCGLSIALDTYFYGMLKAQQNQHTDIINIHVRSPQLSSAWKYAYSITQKTLTTQSNQSQNRFVQKSILHTLLYFHDSLINADLQITLLFDKGYISQASESVNQQSQKFRNYSPVFIKKTGLGSSAGVVVAIVHQLCKWIGSTDLDLINRIAQISNLSAQNKIGSNFDIATAVYGTQVYVNTLPKYAKLYIDKEGWKAKIIDKVFVEDIKRRKIQQLTTNDYRMYMLDMEQGSDTRKMVGSFSKYLGECAKDVREEYYNQSREIVESLEQAIKSENVKEIRKINIRHRKLQQKYSDLSGVQIEPKIFRGLLDQLCSLQNVVYAICPGSGGYDAIAVLATKSVVFPANSGTEIKNGVSYKVTEVSISNEGIQEGREEEELQIQFYLSNI